MGFVLDPPPQASVAVAGTDQRFPVRRVFCVGRNYAAHAREMGNDPDREAPFFFDKPADAVVDAPCTLPYPKQTQDLHHEIELVIALGAGGTDLSVGDVESCLWGAGVGIDLTRRDLQTEAKRMGRPWDMAKGFDRSAPISALRPLGDIESLASGRIWLAVNGATRQDADLGDMIWAVPELVAELSRYVALAAGDLIMTGTPAGVASLAPGDVVTGGVASVGQIKVTFSDTENDANFQNLLGAQAETLR